VLVGVSGGVDSVALLHALHAGGWKRLVIAHLNHGLRGRAAALDAAFVRRLGARLGLRVIEARADTAAVAIARKLSPEAAAREARYEFFAEAARQARCRTVVVAHHADDQAETFLFNLLRGSGPAGLGGMRARSVRRIGGMELEILRPLLGVWRGEIEEYARRHRLRHREDASNASARHTRNRLRRTVIPFLSKEFGRDVRPSLWRAAEIIAAEQEWLMQCVPAAGPELSIPALRALPEALQRQAIHGWLRENGVGQITFELVEKIRALIPAGAAGAKANLPGGRFARRRAGKLFVAGEDPRDSVA
jgi:tRNA(Ile)-lysidine synthetase-like protein